MNGLIADVENGGQLGIRFDAEGLLDVGLGHFHACDSSPLEYWMSSGLDGLWVKLPP